MCDASLKRTIELFFHESFELFKPLINNIMNKKKRRISHINDSKEKYLKKYIKDCSIQSSKWKIHSKSKTNCERSEVFRYLKNATSFLPLR
jgi:hypothetical protein